MRDPRWGRSGNDPSELPDGITAERHRDLAGRTREPLTRRVVLLALAAPCALDLTGFFGRQAGTTTAAGPAATLVVEAPDRLRGGLFAQGRLHVEAHTRIAQPRLVLGPGWVDDITINTISPAPADQAEDGGALVLAYGALPAGERLTVWIELQAQARMQQIASLEDVRVAVLETSGQVSFIPRRG